jgi:hypothetical protein
MQKLSINYLKRQSNIRQKGPYYKYFSAYFDYMLYAENQNAADDHHDDWYVPDAKVQEFLESTRTSNLDQIYAITGLKGIGKTTHIRKVFGASMEPVVDKNQITIPYYLNNFVTPSMNIERDRIMNLLRKTIDDLKSIYNFNETVHDFCDYVLSQKQSLLDLTDTNYEFGNRINPQTVISNLKEKHPIAYWLLKFKFVLKNTTVRKIHIVIDDLESAPSEFVIELINFLVIVRNCLVNVRPHSKTFSTNLLISCRPNTLDNIKSSDRTNFFAIVSSFWIEKPVSVKNIFERRLFAAVKRVDSNTSILDVRMRGAQDRDDWMSACNILSDVVDKLTERHGDLLVGVSNYNVRDILLRVRRCLEYPHWSDLEYKGIPGAFRLSELRHTMTENKALRSLVLGDQKVLTQNSERNWFIPFRSFFSSSDRLPSEARLLLPYVVKYLYRLGGKSYCTFDSEEIFEVVTLLFGSEVDRHKIDECLDYMLSCETVFLERQVKSGDISVRYFVTRPRLFYIWKCCLSSLSFLEVVRDIFDFSETEFRKLATTEITEDLQGEPLFSAMSEFIVTIATLESKLVRRFAIVSDEERRKLARFFGRGTIARRLVLTFSVQVRRYYQLESGTHQRLRANLISKIDRNVLGF